MVAGQCRLPWIGKGIKKVTWKEKNEDRSYEFDVYRLQFNYSDIGQKTKIEDIDE